MGEPELISAINKLTDTVNEFRKEIEAKMDTNMAKYDEKLQHMENAMMAGFPDKDPKAHCQYHEGIIARVQRAVELQEKVKANVVGWTIVTTLGAIVLALYHEFVRRP